MAKYIDKVVVPIKEGSTTTNTTLYLVDGTLASWARESLKPLYSTSEIECDISATSGPLASAQRLDEALDAANDALISLESSIASLGLSISSNTISLTVGGTGVSSITLPVYNGSVT